VCRLDLVFDEASGKMAIAPFETDHHVEPAPTRPRTIPAPAIEPKKPK
jgi:hypothetical protein